jgi:hypothetical protein
MVIMNNPNETLVALERQFWQSMVDQDIESALAILADPAVMVSEHGAMKFDHAGYRKMAKKGSMVLTSFKFSDMQVAFPNETTAVLTYRVKQQMAPRGETGGLEQEMNDSSTWIKDQDNWKCIMHTETPAAEKL